MQGKRKNIVKKVVDVCMTVLLLFLIAYQVTGEKWHEWLGVATVVLLVLHHLQTVISYTVDDNLIALVEPLHFLLLVVGLHTDRCFRLHHLCSRNDDIFTFFLFATANRQNGHQKHSKQLYFLHCLD